MSEQSTSNEEEQGAWARPASARFLGLMAGLAFLATGAFFAGFATLLPFGRVGLPGPGFFPFFLGIGLIALALSILYYTWQEPRGGAPIYIGHRDVVIAIAGMAGVAFGFEADAYLAMGLFTAFLLIFVARAPLWRVALGSVLGMVAVWLFFGLALGLRLPAGDYWQDMWDFVTAALPFGQQ